jgi:hypothetical protein
MRKELRKSHILPEFFYVETYDEKHRAIQVTSQPGEKEMFIQKGEREKLLCGDCELHIRLHCKNSNTGEILSRSNAFPDGKKTRKQRRIC